MAKLKIRPITEADIPRLVAIERAITQQGPITPLERSIHSYIYYGDPDLRLAAEVDGRIVGFLIGEVRPWEFGHEEVAWIKVVGVDPAHQGQGIGRALGDALLAALRAKGIHRVRTLVDWDAGDMVTYFKALGFGPGNQLVLEKEL